MDEYLDWIARNGGSYSKLDFRRDQETNGTVHATETVYPNDTFATVPFRVTITEKVARKTFADLSDVSCRNVMALFVAYQSLLGDQSFYAPYLNILPKQILTPFFWETEDLHYLDQTNLATAVRERKLNIFNDYEALVVRLSAELPFPYTLIDPTHTEPSEVLFPLVDSLNHKPNTKITWVRSGDDQSGSLSFVSGQVFNAGEEMFNNYGPKSNEELLLGYGFCFEVNEHDHVALKPNFSRDPNGQVKLEILKQCHIESGNPDPLTYYVHREHIPQMFLKLMRVLVMNQTEAKIYIQCKDSQQLEWVGYRNELAMVAMTCALLQSRLNAIRAVELNRETTRWVQRCALMYRDGQEQILALTLISMENLKQTIFKKMARDKKQERIAPVTPFVNYLNPGYFESLTYPDLEAEGLVMMDSVTITLGQLLRDKKFKSTIEQLFEDIEEEEDVVWMIGLLHERTKKNSPWKPFFEKTEKAYLQEHQNLEELEDLHGSLFPAFSEAFPDIFAPQDYTVQLFGWADMVMNTYTIENPLCVVPL
ncbi:hypothetical protein PHYBLDRAFT_169118 [Phycomyces blakesleeanus NRRL 1555(-)]|uniref:SET domain-containing protein n=1 Tax=Phycomyces blakesleeanus (strain ATCC 8743b / DSM 1359 / FGSC 10004 / NBRC 33097 / NRRL 1555) TaxID=763407 RepID=A0A167MHH1_PHYB8|nr:hypothetical protein PHYBLDRAFT_169118 [Phycomyces blakesleeanus NRRL 1555(-)]OAD72856.1 hypothetical protein PHYBLDRAFT_169118 [Phycomyces blakesleeanus NRRL 1555(-)]|eukprot:XP_018290896.1 hypothetical protein PHYBLDRAFT_169118 [Phycomyces blakesleeanus NRRL 1555(-)]